MNNIYVENARIIFKNFRAEPSQFNKDGAITFSVVIEDPNEAIRLADEGWNIKQTKGNPDEGVEPIYHLPVAARFDVYPPKVYLVQHEKKILLDNETISVLDQLSFENIDLIIRPYEYHLQNGESGIKAYLQKGYFVEDIDDLDEKYADYETYQA